MRLIVAFLVLGSIAFAQKHEVQKPRDKWQTLQAAPNAKPDGSDDPAGRQKNRRVEVTIGLCKAT